MKKEWTSKEDWRWKENNLRWNERSNKWRRKCLPPLFSLSPTSTPFLTSSSISLHLIPIISLHLLHLFPPPSVHSLSPMKRVEESGIGPILFNQNTERLFWLLSPLAPEVFASVSCTQITFSENYCALRTSLKKKPSFPGKTVVFFFSWLWKHIITYFMREPTRNRLVDHFGARPHILRSSGLQ